MVDPRRDAFGEVIRARFMGQSPAEIVERDDGYIDVTPDTGYYFAPFRRWSPDERAAMRYARGRVLDVGCGAGRHCLYLQERGLDVVGIDPSPLAVTVSRLRGVRRCLDLSFAEALARPRRLGAKFDTVTMMGNNFGLFESPQRAKQYLARLMRITNPGARIVAATRDPYDTDRPEHLAYHRRNRRAGRPGGQVRIRVRYRGFTTPWFWYLMVSKRELERIVEGTGWRLIATCDAPGNVYTAVLERG